VTLDEELKEKAGDLNSKKQQFQAVARSATGNLLVRSLDSVIKPEVLVDTEYLVSVFVVVNDHSVDAFMKEYESLNNWVVPRSAIEVTREEDLVLFRVVIFKKVLADFKTSAREKRYTVREHTPAEGGEGGAADGEKARTALKDAIEKQQKSLTRWCIINYSEVFQAWTHLKTIRVFVESVLRYGLPANFESALLKPVKKNDRKLRQLLEQTYRHLGSGGKAADEPQGEAFYPYVSIDVNVDGENPHEL
jgi:V-type H+-transporting ATPase subunit C